MITRGRFAKMYWIGVIACGCLIPLALVAANVAVLLPLAGIFALAGLYLAEHLWVRAPQHIPLS